MINPLSSLGGVAAAAKAGAVTPAAPVKPTAPVAKSGETRLATPAATMAAAGAPVDTAKVDRIKAGIAAGSYTADAGAIASRMVDLDLPSGQ